MLSEKELTHANLGDARLNHRLGLLVERSSPDRCFQSPSRKVYLPSWESTRL